jgi:hypothetical protein
MIERFGLAVAPLCTIEFGQVVKAPSHIGMLGSQYPFIERQRSMIKTRLGGLWAREARSRSPEIGWPIPSVYS